MGNENLVHIHKARISICEVSQSYEICKELHEAEKKCMNLSEEIQT